MSDPASAPGDADWPNQGTRRIVEADGLRWHVEVTGRDRPALLLLHGTGAATHSWRHLVPLLAPHFTLVAPDFPGHGQTEAAPKRLLTLPGMAHGVAAVLQALAIAPAFVIGHSAGAAVMLRMALDGQLGAARGLVSLNGALVPFEGAAARVFSPLARVLFSNPVMPRLFAWRAGDTASVARLIRNTGSTLDAEGVELYRRLVADPKHVAAALGMMAHWDLDALHRDLPRLDRPLLLIAGQNDRAIRAEDAFLIRDRVPGAAVALLRGLGHLAHEEKAADVADPILAFARKTGALGVAATDDGSIR